MFHPSDGRLSQRVKLLSQVDSEATGASQKGSIYLLRDIPLDSRDPPERFQVKRVKRTLTQNRGTDFRLRSR
jgi:hypothetical protein